MWFLLPSSSRRQLFQDGCCCCCCCFCAVQTPGRARSPRSVTTWHWRSRCESLGWRQQGPGVESHRTTNLPHLVQHPAAARLWADSPAGGAAAVTSPAREPALHPLTSAVMMLMNKACQTFPNLCAFLCVGCLCVGCLCVGCLCVGCLCVGRAADGRCVGGAGPRGGGRAGPRRAVGCVQQLDARCWSSDSC